MTVRVRFAPSPTGLLHLGSARGALLNWLFAKRHGGTFLLRLDDTDRDRSIDENARLIEEDLRWLGLDWDEYARQFLRVDRYRAAAERLKESGRLYPCYETPEELELQRFRQVASGGVQIYDRAALRLSKAQIKAYEDEGRKPHWRFMLEPGEVAWIDMIRGPVKFQGTKLSDPVLIRADGTPIYTLASVVDDIEFGITHIIRGEDHVTNTAVQLQLFMALNRGPDDLNFAHFTLLQDISGHKLSKRGGSLSIGALRDQGLEAMAINSMLARLGTSDPIEPKGRLDELIEGFDLNKFSRAAPKLELEDLQRLNAKLLHELPFRQVVRRLYETLHIEIDEAFWLAVRPNIATLAEVREWWEVCRGTVAPVIADTSFASTAATLLPPEPWDDKTWSAWTKAVGAQTGRKGKELFMPLRQALTAREHGPELKSLLPIIGRERAAARLSGIAA